MPKHVIHEWEARDAAHTLRRAEEIKMDSKLVAAAEKALKKEMESQAKAMAAVKRAGRKNRKA